MLVVLILKLAVPEFTVALWWNPKMLTYWILFIKSFVAMFEDVQFGVEQEWVLFSIQVPVLSTDPLMSCRGPALWEFTVQDDNGVLLHERLDPVLRGEQILVHAIRRAMVDCTLNMSTIVFVLVSTVNDDNIPSVVRIWCLIILQKIFEL